MQVKKIIQVMVLSGIFGCAPSFADALSDLKNQVEQNMKDTVVKGDIDGSFRLPGSETSVRLYGYAEAHLLKDFDVTAPGDDFTNVGELPLGKGNAVGKSRITAQTSRLGLQTSTPTAKGSFTTKLEMDFYAYCGSECNRDRIRIRHGYGEYAGLLIGKTWSTWMDLDNSPETVDFNGAIGAGFARNPMLRYSYDVPGTAKFTVALEDPTEGAATQKFPNVIARLDKSFDWGNVVIRGLSSRIQKDGRTKSGSGIGIGGAYKITDNDLLMAQYNRVTGDYGWKYMVGANGVISGENGAINDQVSGFQIGLAHTFDANLRGNLAYSETNSKDSAEYIATYGSGVNKKLTQYHVNLIYSPLKNIEFGVEYLGGKRKTYDDGENSGTMNRLDFMGRYSF